MDGKLERLAEAINERWPGAKAKFYWTYNCNPKLGGEVFQWWINKSDDLPSASFIIWGYQRLLELNLVPHIFHNNNGEPTVRTTQGSFTGKTIAEAIANALYTALTSKESKPAKTGPSIFDKRERVEAWPDEICSMENQPKRGEK
jgi:hypothetical protein